MIDSIIKWSAFGVGVWLFIAILALILTGDLVAWLEVEGSDDLNARKRTAYNAFLEIIWPITIIMYLVEITIGIIHDAFMKVED